MKKLFFTLLALMTFVAGAWAAGDAMPETSTQSAPKYYMIRNTRANYYANFIGASTQLALSNTVTLENTSALFWFEAVEEAGLAEGVMAVKIHEAGSNLCCASTSSFTESGIVWYLKANVYTELPSVAINSSPTVWNNNSYGWNNVSGSNQRIGTWSSTDKGSAWIFDSVDDNYINLFPLASQTLKDKIVAATDKASSLPTFKNDYSNELASKLFFIKSGYPEFMNKQNKEKAWIAGSTSITWGNFDSNDPQQYFKVNYNPETGKYQIATATDRFLNGSTGSYGTAASITLKKFEDGTFNIQCGSSDPIHANSHNSGSGASGNLVAWAGGAGSCSSWRFEETTYEAYQELINSEKTIKYRLTDMAGNVFEGTYTGTQGTQPTLTGAVGYTLTNSSWSTSTEDGIDYLYTATINFPFPVSKAGKVNYTYIASFESESFLWYAKDNTLKTKKNNKPEMEESSLKAYKWAIYPTLTDGKFTFKIESALGGFLAGTNTSNSATFALNAEGRSYTFATHLTNKTGFYDEASSKFITINSSASNDEQNAWLWISSTGSHNGSNMIFPTENVTLDASKTYAINFTRGNQMMGVYGAVIEDGVVDESLASRTVTTADKATADLFASLWLFEKSDNDVYLKSDLTGFYLAGIENGHLVTTKQKADAKKYTLVNMANSAVTRQLLVTDQSSKALNIYYNPGHNTGRDICYYNAGDAGNIFTMEEVTEAMKLTYAKDKALASLPDAKDGVFAPGTEDIAGWTTAINDATTLAEVQEAVATIGEWTAPATQGYWYLKNTSADKIYMGTNESSVVFSATLAPLTFEKAEGYTYYIKNGEKYINMKGGNTWSMSADATANTAWTFALADGVYTIQGPNGKIGSDATDAGSLLYGDKAANNNGKWALWSDQNTATLKVTDAHVGTFIAPFDCEAPEGVSVWTPYLEDGDKVKFQVVEDGHITANTPYMLYSNDPVEEIYHSESTAEETEYVTALDGISYIGTLVKMEATPGSYILQKNDDVLAFYQVNDGGLYVGKNRCYMTSTGENVKGFFSFSFDDMETAIENLKAEQQAKAVIYDMSGRRVQKATKGLYIINGKKIIK